MKFQLFSLSALAFAVSSLFLTSCESTNSRRAGGGAFDDSHLGPKLDANSHLDDPETPGARSYEEWREQ